MIGCLLIVVVTVCGLAEGRLHSVCYNGLGCFSNAYPFDHFKHLPRSPEDMELRSLLYTRKNKVTAESVGYNNSRSLGNSHFDASKPVKVVIHGYLSSGTRNWMQNMKNALLIRGDFNVFLIDWKKGSGIVYSQSAANTRTVAAAVKRLLDIVVVKGVSWDDVHIIGHSLGAQAAGMIGRLSGSKVGRISGLDPAKPSFENKSLLVRLDKTDAKFVDAIHTNMDKFTVLSGFGTTNPSGHVDFYPNGGKKQPGCSNLKIACSHKRSHDYYEESIYAQCNFVGYPCESYADFDKGKCTKCGLGGCSKMGYFADTAEGRGAMYLNTKRSSPYCGYPYLVTVVPDAATKSRNGKLILTLHGSKQSTQSIGITDRNTKLPTTQVFTRLVVFDRQITDLGSLSVKFVGPYLFPFNIHYVFSKIQITDLKTMRTLTTCRKSHDLKEGSTYTITLGSGSC